MHRYGYEEQILLLFSTPFYMIVIGLEVLLSNLHFHKKAYSVRDTLTNIYLTLATGLIDMAFKWSYLWGFRGNNGGVTFLVLRAIATMAAAKPAGSWKKTKRKCFFLQNNRPLGFLYVSDHYPGTNPAALGRQSSQPVHAAAKDPKHFRKNACCRGS